MQSYKDLTQYFGVPLSDANFQSFIKRKFSDLTDYNVAENDYMVSENSGIELGFTNRDAVFDEDEGFVYHPGRPVFSHITIYPISPLRELPFQASFGDSRSRVITKAGQPSQSRRGEASFLGSTFFVDHYKIDDLVISFNYQPENERINFIQIRDNNLVAHLRI